MKVGEKLDYRVLSCLVGDQDVVVDLGAHNRLLHVDYQVHGVRLSGRVPTCCDDWLSSTVPPDLWFGLKKRAVSNSMNF